jgi:hypothetical protein
MTASSSPPVAAPLAKLVDGSRYIAPVLRPASLYAACYPAFTTPRCTECSLRVVWQARRRGLQRLPWTGSSCCSRSRCALNSSSASP